jgi:hypothetical protein
MSTALAIAGVTAVLQSYLYNLYFSASVADIFSSTVTVSCQAPDQVQKLVDSGSGSGFPRANLFLHQVSPNAAWRNVDYASMSSDGTQRLSSPPLALDLHYLLTAYGVDAWEAEALLGYGLMMLHEAPVLTRSDISGGLTMATSPPSFNTNAQMNTQLAACGLADQVELMKITPESMTREEMAWLWTALKADYRPTFPFQVSVVLMQPGQQATYALPVLQVNYAAFPLQPAQILAVTPSGGQGTAAPGDPNPVTISGEFLKGATEVALVNSRFVGQPLTFPAAQVQNTSLTFLMPASPAPPNDFPAGIYQLQVQIPATPNTSAQWTNRLPMAVAPVLPATQAGSTAPAPDGDGVIVTITQFSPPIREGQSVVLSLTQLAGGSFNGSAPAEPFADRPASLDFHFTGPAPPTGAQFLARLVVDGVSSQVTFTPPPWPLPPPPPPPFPFTGPWVTL